MQGKPAGHIAIHQHPSRVRIVFAGEVVAASDNALALCEGDYPPVLYIPRADARLPFYLRTEHSTHCPYKGDAAYFSLAVGDSVAMNAVWTYEAPFDAVAAIKGHLAFYPNRVDAIEA